MSPSSGPIVVVKVVVLLLVGLGGGTRVCRGRTPMLLGVTL